jgi:hypothetical protein
LRHQFNDICRSCSLRFSRAKTDLSDDAIGAVFDGMAYEPYRYYEPLESLLCAKETELQSRIFQSLRQSIVDNEPELAQLLRQYAPLVFVKELLEVRDLNSRVAPFAKSCWTEKDQYRNK